MNHRPDIGFENGPVPLEDFDYDGMDGPEAEDKQAIARDAAARLVDWLLEPPGDGQAIQRRVEVLACAFKLPRGARTLAELAARLGVSKTRAHQIVREFGAERKTIDFAD